MSALSFYLVLPFIYLFSLLPFRVLYLISDLLYPVGYYLIGYRKKVALRNLRNAFPEKSEAEIRQIARRFYRHLNDVLMENLKLFSLSPARLRRRIQWENPEALMELIRQGKSMIGVLAHYNNWEYTLGLSRQLPMDSMVLYKPLHNPYFDRFILKNRSRFGTELVSMHNTLRVMLQYREQKRLAISVFIADQSTIWEETQYWTNFLNQLTPVHLGIEKMARRLDQAVVFLHMKKIRRGHYRMEAIRLFDEVTGLPDHAITERHVQVLEEIIRRDPTKWLWTHRRWKLTPKKLAQLEAETPGT